MKRIAADLGVSITTVSKVLNGQPDIGTATRARVMARVEELGYRPNAVARSLTLRRTHTLGVIIPDLMHSFFVEVVAGIESVVSARGYGLLLCSSGEDPLKERRELEILRARQVDGIVVGSAPASRNGDVLTAVTSLGAALVMIDKEAATLLLDQIGPHPSGPYRRVVIPPRLIVRQSCGASAGGVIPG